MNLKEIRQLVRFLVATDVTEIEIQDEGGSVRIHRSSVGARIVSTRSDIDTQAGLVSPAPSSSVVAAAPSPSVPGFTSTAEAITSPMVGTYYQAASPDAPAFVSLGDVVKKGQVVCIIEAMKLMNEIESEFSGRVVGVLKENASPVEYGEFLFMIEPV